MIVGSGVHWAAAGNLWTLTALLSLGITAAFSAAGPVYDYIPVALALTTTALIIYRRVLPLSQRVEMTFITATAMPLLIALAEIGVQDGKMLPSNAAAMVGAGVLSVLVFPAVAAGLARRGRAGAARPPEAAADPHQ